MQTVLLYPFHTCQILMPSTKQMCHLWILLPSGSSCHGIIQWGVGFCTSKRVMEQWNGSGWMNSRARLSLQMELRGLSFNLLDCDSELLGYKNASLGYSDHHCWPWGPKTRPEASRPKVGSSDLKLKNHLKKKKKKHTWMKVLFKSHECGLIMLHHLWDADPLWWTPVFSREVDEGTREIRLVQLFIHFGGTRFDPHPDSSAVYTFWIFLAGTPSSMYTVYMILSQSCVTWSNPYVGKWFLISIALKPSTRFGWSNDVDPSH